MAGSRQMPGRREGAAPPRPGRPGRSAGQAPPNPGAAPPHRPDKPLPTPHFIDPSDLNGRGALKKAP